MSPFRSYWLAVQDQIKIEKIFKFEFLKYKKSKAQKTFIIFYIAKKKHLIQRTNTSDWIKLQVC